MVGHSVENKITEIQERILEVCQKVKRRPEDIRLIAVSKLQTGETIRQAWGAGLRSFGENYVQEALQKQQELQDLKIDWHFIGSLQSNKVKQVIGHFAYIHSVDRLSLVKEISKRANELGLTQNILCEVNLAGEKSKAGVPEQSARELIQEALFMPNLRVCGLMIMPPLAESKDESRPYFQRAHKLLKEWREQMTSTQAESFKELSMGTSQDFEIAIEEGATMIRLGTSILGERQV